MTNLTHLVGKRFNIMHEQLTGFNVITSGVVADIIGDEKQLTIIRVDGSRSEEFGFGERDVKIMYGNSIAIVTFYDGSRAYVDFFERGE